jgi:phosphohistidine swiveling domain-containing protein
MADVIRIQDLSTEKIAALLAADGNQLSAAQVAALREFIEDIGGIENARDAVEMLGELDHAA